VIVDSPLVTVGIPCFNAGDSIIRAIHSACSQKWNNLEILVVDDCSTDNSVDLIRENSKSTGENVRLVCNDINLGTGAVRQKILELSKGEFLIFFDDDDESLPDRISQQYKAIINAEHHFSTKMIACYASGERIYSSGYRKQLTAIGSRDKAPCGELVADYLLYHRIDDGFFYGAGTPSCSLMARVSTFVAAGGFDEKLRRVEDVDFAIRLALQDGCFIGTEQALFLQYSTDAQDKSPEKNLTSEQLLIEKYKDYLNSKGLFEYAYNWPKLRYYHFSGNYIALIKELFVIFLRYPLRTVRHFFRTATRRLIHEYRINKGINQESMH